MLLLVPLRSLDGVVLERRFSERGSSHRPELLELLDDELRSLGLLLEVDVLDHSRLVGSP